MIRSFDPKGILQLLVERVADKHWLVAETVLLGRLGSQRCRIRCFESGLTVALSIERTQEQAMEVCLILATMPEACDDGLYLEDGRLWLLRRYLPRLTEVEFDLLLKQQQTLVSLLAHRPKSSGRSMPAIGLLA